MAEFSRFKATQTITYEGSITYGVWKPLKVLQKEYDTDDYKIYQVPSNFEGRPDLISDVMFKTPFLDWVLIAYNRVKEPFGWPRSNELIKIPKSSLFLSELIS